MIKVRFYRFQLDKINKTHKGQFTLNFSSVEDLVNFCMKMNVSYQNVMNSNYNAFHNINYDVFHGRQLLSFVNLTEDIGSKNEKIFYRKYGAIFRNKSFSPKFPNVKNVH